MGHSGQHLESNKANPTFKDAVKEIEEWEKLAEASTDWYQKIKHILRLFCLLLREDNARLLGMTQLNYYDLDVIHKDLLLVFNTIEKMAQRKKILENREKRWEEFFGQWTNIFELYGQNTLFTFKGYVNAFESKGKKSSRSVTSQITLDDLDLSLQFSKKHKKLYKMYYQFFSPFIHLVESFLPSDSSNVSS